MTLQEPSAGPGAQSETLVFLSFFEGLPDPRQTGKVIYPLREVLLLCLLAVLAGAESFVEIARFGEKKIELLRRFLPFKDGTPSHDQLGDISGQRVEVNTSSAPVSP
jgi:DDE_Tnp_1-associated